ncbi:hypothetical protein LRS10_13080 [Phenylobacterium sp. J426]|uniref:hypothetical protein n=1 Tax=Phenylobacterium sp. J426 TaxID=2898439 RepID=UPI0021514B7B|nr:hypothetical protein [Phenylobacterium sp. J426]MCR5875031.1 hypothetical protein [Phenylobacterium sp. J426]
MADSPRARRTSPMSLIVIAVVFAVAATVAFLLYDANRPRALDAGGLPAAAPSAADQGRPTP